FPFIGLAAAVVWWIAIRAERWSKERVVSRPLAVSGAAWATGMLVLSFHAIGTHARNRVWLSEETLWADVASKSPSNGRGLMNYGLSQMQQGRYGRAKDLFTRAQTFAPNDPVLEVNLAIVNEAMGDGIAA